MRKKLLLLVLLSITILWLLACFQHVSAYNQMIEKAREQWGDEATKLIDFYPVWVWEWGELYLLGGLFISMAWIVSIYELIAKLKKR